jgi:Cation transporter/ATPase, N-terminus
MTSALPAECDVRVRQARAEAERLLEVHGRNELPEKKTPSWLVFLLQMRAPMPIGIWCAVPRRSTGRLPQLPVA